MPDAVPQFGVVLFHTSSAALRAEKVLRREGLPIKMVPTPRQFSSDCGVALRFEWRSETHVRELLDSAHANIASIRKME
jgi:hypothetical protein